MECKFAADLGMIIPTTRINRYIMECKSLRTPHLLLLYIELIDTLWNVNCVKMNTAKSSRIVN